RHQLDGSADLYAAFRRRLGLGPKRTIDWFLNQLRIASEGNFMYLEYMLEDIRSPERQSEELRLTSLPVGLDGYYGQFWTHVQGTRIENWERWRELSRPALGATPAAREPITLAWLSDHTGRDPEELNAFVLPAWERFLIRETRAGIATWRIIHQSFADFL